MTVNLPDKAPGQIASAPVLETKANQASASSILGFMKASLHARSIVAVLLLAPLNAAAPANYYRMKKATVMDDHGFDAGPRNDDVCSI